MGVLGRTLAVYLLVIIFPGASSHQAAGCSHLRGGSPGADVVPDSLGRALQDMLKPDDLWPSGPAAGDLDVRFQGYLRRPEVTRPTVRIPNVLHRIIFLGAECGMQEQGLIEIMDGTMASAYLAWEAHNAGHMDFRSELWNLEKAEVYINEHFESKVLAAFRHLQPYAYKSDLFRYLVLYNEGGWYVDLKLGLPSEDKLSLNQLLDRVAAELSMDPAAVGFVGTGQDMVWNVPGAEGIMNAFLGAKPRIRLLGDTIVRIVDDILASAKGYTPWSLTGPYALYVGLGKRQRDGKKWQDFRGGEEGVALMRFGFDEWHLPTSDSVVLRKASRGECGGGWVKLGGNNYVDMWFHDRVFDTTVPRP